MKPVHTVAVPTKTPLPGAKMHLRQWGFLMQLG